ncbi:hypothetical protein RHMOL_Rhmol05G0203400 [Rhododendron molle]|uniref:Uncharacterized protein n=1 Tax=Rhododendron molle TaxID=49168 RepID=A0ACC0NRB4_RHOML|nr:hypothetical protein RHMOL_Rhmol05G0203400 [Rhododendron molle]
MRSTGLQDRDGANPERVMDELASIGLMPEKWGGDVPVVQVSALKWDNVDELLETVMLVVELDMLLKGLGFTKKKADSQVRWAVLNIVLMLRRHEEAWVKLVEAMSEGRSVGFCIDVIEKTTNAVDI